MTGNRFIRMTAALAWLITPMATAILLWATAGMSAAEDLNGARGRIHRVDPTEKTFVLLKETVFDPQTREGKSRHLVAWSDSTVFTRVVQSGTNRNPVVTKSPAAAGDLSRGFWETTIHGRHSGDRFVVERMDIYPLTDPRATDDPNLPRVLVVGDSISMNYHDAAKAALQGVANYHRIDGNGGPSDRGVACMELWLGDYQEKGLHWDVIQFNHGLHDLKQSYDKTTDTWGAHQVPIDDYKKNLEREIGIMAKTGAKLIWCPTTPVPNHNTGSYARRKDEDLAYNKAAMEVIARHPEIRVNDLNTLVRESNVFDPWRKGVDVHFWDKNLQQVLGRAVARAVRDALSERAGKAATPQAAAP